MSVQVFQALRSDFSSRRKDRCVRVDFSGGMVSGVDDLERMLRDAIKSTFETRAAAYDEQVAATTLNFVIHRQSRGITYACCAHNYSAPVSCPSVASFPQASDQPLAALQSRSGLRPQAATCADEHSLRR